MIFVAWLVVGVWLSASTYMISQIMRNIIKVELEQIDINEKTMLIQADIDMLLHNQQQQQKIISATKTSLGKIDKNYKRLEAELNRIQRQQ